MAKKPLTPTFTDNADLQATLAKQYVADQATIRQLLDANKLGILGTLRGYRGSNFAFTVGHLAYEPAGEAEENGYRQPIGSLEIALRTQGQEERIAVAARKDGTYMVAIGGQNAVTTTNAARVIHAVEGWRIEMDEKFSIDTTAGIRQQEFTRTKTLPGGPRPEKK